MERYAKRLQDIINEQDFCFEPKEMGDVEKALGRFAAYEDTGLEPEDIIELKQVVKFEQAAKSDIGHAQIDNLIQSLGDFISDMDEKSELQAYRALGTVEELTALVKARDEGLLLEMPCKPGTELFGHCHVRGANPISRSYFYPPYIPKLGVDAWLTRAEAEAALSAQKGGSHEADLV